MKLEQQIKDNLIKKAHLVSKHAYAPYSKYKVGAALLVESGKIFSGCNVENSSYGLTICAERAAVFNAISNGEKRFVAIAVYASQSPLPVPCGACLQVLTENGNKPLIIVVKPSFETLEFSMDELLPRSFSLD